MGCFSSKLERQGSSTRQTGAQNDAPEQLASADNGSMGKARTLLQALMTLKGPDAGSRAAEIILKQLGCGTVNIVACTSRPDVFVRLSGQGLFPGRTHHRSQVLLSSDSCAAGLFRTSPAPAVLYRTVNTAEEASSTLPKDWELEYHNGMRTFLAMPIFAHSTEPMLGVLTLSSFQPGAFWESWWEPLLGIIAAGLVPLLQERLTQGLVEMAMHVLSTASISDFVTAVLQRTSLLLESTYNKSMSVRLGLLSPDKQTMLLVLPPQGPGRGGHQSGMTISCGSLTDDLRILHLPTSNTLLLEALSSGQPCVVSNTATYLEGFKEPCKDIFVEADDVVSSIVAAPLLISRHMHSKGCLSQCQQGIADVVHSPTGHKKASGSSPRHHKHPRMHTDPAHPEQTHEPAQQPPQQQQPVPPHSQWYGCLFVAHQSPYAFETELHAITAVSKMLGVLMMQCMPPSMAWRELSDLRLAKSSARHCTSSSSSTYSSSTIASRTSVQTDSQHLPTLVLGADNADDAAGAGLYAPVRRSCSLDTRQTSIAASAASPSSPASAPLGPSVTIATSSIVETLRRQVQDSRDRRLKRDTAYVQELQLQQLIGRGGFGTVYAGTWQRTPVAVKVMYVMRHERQLMKSAMEMAVLTSVQHPNIVRVYACLTDLVEEAGSITEGSCNPLLGVRYRPYGSDTADAYIQHSTLCNLVVMERCDRGNLHMAMRRGLLHKRLPEKGLVVDMRLLNTVLLQVAHSLQHLHQHGIIHSDVKCENVLLMSSSSSPIGLVCKLGDFGLVRLLMGHVYVHNRSGSGTVAYQAPEVFVAGSKLTPAVDVYAFGVMMYELYCCRRPYAGVSKDTIAKRVCRHRQRPAFPLGTWPKYQQLAERCWDPEPDNRPDCGEIICRLTELLDAAGGPFTCGSALDLPVS